jgi:hypothetical protein
MKAHNHLARIAAAIRGAELETVLIGNAAAALQGALVTTMDLEFYYRDSEVNRRKISLVAELVGAKLTQPFTELSSLFRFDYGSVDFHVNFRSVAAGIRSISSLNRRAIDIEIEGEVLRVASLADIVQGTQMSCDEYTNPNKQKDIALLEKAMWALQSEMIQARLRLPMHKRTNFLRVRIPGAPNNGTAL